ncbi:hypothetical protein D3C76_1077750 [compost metagenome]
MGFEILTFGKIGQEPEQPIRTRLFSQAIPGSFPLPHEQIAPGHDPVSPGLLIDHLMGITCTASGSRVVDTTCFVQILHTAFRQRVVMKVQALKTQAQAAHFPLQLADPVVTQIDMGAQRHVFMDLADIHLAGRA